MRAGKETQYNSWKAPQLQLEGKKTNAVDGKVAIRREKKKSYTYAFLLLEKKNEAEKL